MINFSLLSECSKNYVTFPFYKNDLLLAGGPLCGLSLKKAGSMRFRWAEKNDVRTDFLDRILADGEPELQIAQVQLDHTKDVFAIEEPCQTLNKIGDGIITKNKKIVPVVTVADCVPIYLYDSVTGVFGIVHSGWKGTGIAAVALSLAKEKYGAQPENFSVVIGPHIHDCCYVVDENRAEYFRKNFTDQCVTRLEPDAAAKLKISWNNGNGTLYALSLAKANLAVLKKAGVPEQNIAVCSDCTCCNQMYGSNRRETKENGRPDAFTVQAAFVKW